MSGKRPEFCFQMLCTECVSPILIYSIAIGPKVNKKSKYIINRHKIYSLQAKHSPRPRLNKQYNAVLSLFITQLSAQHNVDVCQGPFLSAQT